MSMAKHGKQAPSRKEYDWLNDPFDESKQEEDYQRAIMSRRVGCLVAVIVMIIVAIVVCVIGCTAASSLLVVE